MLEDDGFECLGCGWSSSDPGPCFMCEQLEKGRAVLAELGYTYERDEKVGASYLDLKPKAGLVDRTITIETRGALVLLNLDKDGSVMGVEWL